MFAYINTAATKIEVDEKVYVLNENTVLRNEVGVIEYDGAAAIKTAGVLVEDKTKVFDIKVKDENVITSFKYVADKDDKAAAKEVIDKIDAIPAITASDFVEKVEAAREAYDALAISGDAAVQVKQNLVTNYDKLEKAEKAIKNSAATKAVADAKKALDLGDTSAVTADITLKTTDANVTITWKSSDTDVIEITTSGDTTTGKVTRPAYSKGDATVTLTATIKSTKDATVTDTKEFTVKVLKKEESSQEKADRLAKGLKLTFAKGDSATSVTDDITLPGKPEEATSVTWKSSNDAIVSETGVVNRPAGQDIQVTLTATVKVDAEGEATRVFVVTVIAE